MDPITFAQTLLRRWWLVVLLSLAGITIAYSMANSAPPRYQSTVSLQLNPAGRTTFLPYASSGTDPSIGPVVAAAASYREVLKSRAFGQVVVDQLQLPVPPEAIASAISTGLVVNTNILRLTVVWDNPGDAQQLAQHVAEIFIVENQRRQQTQPGTQAQLADMEQSASNIQDRLTPLQQQRQKLTQNVAAGDLSRLAELSNLEDRLGALESSRANLLVEISHIRNSFDTAVIIDPATAAYPVDSTPLSQALIFGLLGGLGAAVGLVLLLEYLGDAVRTRRDVMEVTGAPPLGRVRHASMSRWRRGPRNRALVTLGKGSSHAAEAFRSLRASLRLATTSHPLTTLVITSAGPREGKTFVACNLAVALAQSGKRVLLVDADLRRPSVHMWFGIPMQPGFADALVATDEPGFINSGVDNLWLLPAGAAPANPSEMLGSDALPQVLANLGRRFDAVILDSAPIGPVADTLLLAHQANGSVVVARSGRTRRSTLRAALEALGSTGRPVMGVVLNDERPSPLARFSRYEYFHHGYWSDTLATDSRAAVHSLHANGSLD
jgi:capsular exopolysaccharide synthesis family protein